MADLTFTTIEEAAKEQLNLTRDEYAACNYIQTWASHPLNTRPGWCDRTRDQMAKFVGITPRGLLLMLKRLEKQNLIERYSASQFLYRITEKWFNAVTLAKQSRKGEESSPLGVKKVHPSGEESSQSGVNKVHPHKDSNNTPMREGENAPPPPSGFTIPKKVETADEAEEIIMQWAVGEGRDTVKAWFENAYRPCETRKHVRDMVESFVHAYLTIGDSGKFERMSRDPLRCFKYTFKFFLKKQDQFDREEKQKAEKKAVSTGGAVYEPPSIEVFK